MDTPPTSFFCTTIARNHHKLLANPPTHAYTIVCMRSNYLDIGCLVKVFCWTNLFNTPTLLGIWKQAEPSGCATKCGVAAGKSGTPGAVSCNTTSCDPDTKPAAKQCPKTVDCGACASCMPNPKRRSHHLLLQHPHPQPSQSTSNQATHALAIFPFASILTQQN